MLQEKLIKIFAENKLAIALAKNSIYHERSKHIDIRFYFIRDHIKNKKVKLHHVKTGSLHQEEKWIKLVRWINFKRNLAIRWMKFKGGECWN